MCTSLTTRVVFACLVIMAALAAAVGLAVAAPGAPTAESGRSRAGPALNRRRPGPCDPSSTPTWPGTPDGWVSAAP
jgi:hypothetical protein